MTATQVHSNDPNNPQVIGRTYPVVLVETNPSSPASTHTPAYAAEVRTRDNKGWAAPNGVRHYPTAEKAEEAIRTARANQAAPNIPKGLRLGSNQKHALWMATLDGGQVDDRYGPALAKKGLAKEEMFHHSLTELGYQVADEIFDEDGNLR